MPPENTLTLEFDALVQREVERVESRSAERRNVVASEEAPQTLVPVEDVNVPKTMTIILEATLHWN